MIVSMESSAWTDIEDMANEYNATADRINLYRLLIEARTLLGASYFRGPFCIDELTDEWGAYMEDIIKALDLVMTEDPTPHIREMGWDI